MDSSEFIPCTWCGNKYGASLMQRHVRENHPDQYEISYFGKIGQSQNGADFS